MDMNMYMPTRLITGEGCVRKEANRIGAMGQNCLIVTGKTAAKKCGALDDVLAVMEENGQSYAVFDDIGQNPKLSDCMEAAKVAESLGADVIIGIGGGSPLDAAKCIAVLAANPGMTQEVLYSRRWERAPLPVIAVGTTAGTGSEVTKVAVITNLEGMKKSVNDDRIFPALSLGDYTYTKTLPEFFTRSTAIDAMAHCVESYFTRISNEISRCYSVQGIKILIDVLNRMRNEGFDKIGLSDREKLYNASIYGGLAIHVTGTCMPHTVGYNLSENHGIAHGTACAQFIPDFLKHNRKAAPDLCDAFYTAIGQSEDEFIALIKTATPEVEIHMTAEEVESLRPRYENNASINKIRGEISADEILAMLTKKYVQQ